MERCKPKILICVTFAVWSLFLLKDSHLIEIESTKRLGPPTIETFENYGRYVNIINTKGKVPYQDPINDSYHGAYRYHNNRLLLKREATTANTPKMFKFGVEDAREPDEATKQIIRKHRAQELKDKKRIKRRAPKTEPRFIKFDVSDAKEPDEITKELIRQSRAKELKTTSNPIKVTTTRSPHKQAHKRKRTKRSTQLTQPKFIKFELADAREPKQNIRKMIQNMQGTESKPTSVYANLYSHLNETGIIDDSQVDESKKIFFYQALPLKSKRIANAVPIEVKKIIDLMIRDDKAQVYYKHITSNQEEKPRVLDRAKSILNTGIVPQPSVPLTSNLVTIYQEPAYVQKLVPIHIPIPTIPFNSITPSLQTQPTDHSAHPATVPSAVNSQDFYHPLTTLSQSQMGTAIYQQPHPYLKVIPAANNIFKEIPISQTVSQQQISHLSTNVIANNEISKTNPYAKIIPMEASYRYGKGLHSYPQIQSHQFISANGKSNHNTLNMDPTNQLQQQTPNKNEINNEQQQNALRNNQEFQELSSLIGKSPTDQIHGLAYLLAKEMQRNKRLKEERPQDNTSPILFHPEKPVSVNNEISQESGELQTQPELISHPVSEPLPPSYPAIQHDSLAKKVSGDSSQPSVPLPPPTPPPTSYTVVKNLGLSPNYAGIDQFDESPKIQPNVENEGLQYASKYAFGYRVRDFYSGNDFGHKQNRDLDGVTRGQYHILLPDGRVQNVIYHADDTGFHADVSFETGHH